MAELQHKFVTTNGIYSSFSKRASIAPCTMPLSPGFNARRSRLSRDVILTMETSV
jgi:hypothetical protein